MLFLALIALNAAAPDEPDWREFERRPRGWGETPTLYDAARIERRGTRVRTWIRYQIMLSGLPDPQFEMRVEIDCARRRTRTLESMTSDRLGSFAGRGHGGSDFTVACGRSPPAARKRRWRGGSARQDEVRIALRCAGA